MGLGNATSLPLDPEHKIFPLFSALCSENSICQYFETCVLFLTTCAFERHSVFHVDRQVYLLSSLNLLWRQIADI